MWLDNLLAFTELGFRHIVPLGLDHVLFIAAMYLAATGWRSLILQVTAFTLAHTLSLALTVLGVIEPPAGIVEPLIAASIVVVAVTIMVRRVPTSWKTSIILIFGLLHGLGFAGVIRGYLEGAELVTGLIGFNLGVELGQLAVLAVVAAAATAIRLALTAAGNGAAYRKLAVIPAAFVIAAIGTLMLLSRLPVAGDYLPEL